MAEPFLSEIKVFSFSFAPKGWAMCNGQLLPINQNQALFSLLGTTYGGDGRVTFALPNLQSRIPLHTGAGFTLGQNGGEEIHTLSVAELPGHSHLLKATSNPGVQVQPAGAVLATPTEKLYVATGAVPLTPSVAATGGGQPHENRQPFLCLNFCIALQGIFPSQN
ncbi:MAG: phage Tail Collar domain protein [Nevskia sp.]|nr:phage Tail Collar domain protein [Nevskia sp.]